MTRRHWLAAGLGLSVTGNAQNIDQEIRAAANEAPLRMRFKGRSAAECREWQQSFATKLSELLGPFQPPARWEAITEKRTDQGDHERHAILLHAEGCRDLPVYLLKPRTSPGRHPGILALHGHGRYGYDAVAGIATTPESKESIERANYGYALELVRRGYVVAAPCLTPFGRRLGDEKAYKGDDPCAVTFVRMQLIGKLLISENLRDALWALELLAQQETVDASRLGCVGLSYGGRMTMLTAAVSDRIRVAVISGALNMMQERILGRYSCGAQVIPGLLEYGDVPEITSLIAPRPCLWEVGSRDPLIVKDRIPGALERMRRAWSALDAAANLDVDEHDGGHRWNGVKAYPLLARVLDWKR